MFMSKRLMGLLTTAVLVFAACSSGTTTASPGSPTGAPTTAPNATPTAVPTAVPIELTGTTYKAVPATTTGGSIVLSEYQYPDTINPYYAQAETDIEVSGSMFDGLLSVSPDLKYVPDLATNIPTVDNGGVKIVGSGMDVTWTLRPGMKWSDGQPITCAGGQATWKWIMDPAQAGLAGGTIGWEADLKYVPDLATNIPTVDNGGGKRVGSGMDVTGTRRPGMKWSDGQPITCADVQATWKWIMAPAQAGSMIHFQV